MLIIVSETGEESKLVDVVLTESNDKKPVSDSMKTMRQRWDNLKVKATSIYDLREVEKLTIREALHVAQTIVGAAKLLGVTRVLLYQKIDRLEKEQE